jgi:uncharacterized protein with NRDE domain
VRRGRGNNPDAPSRGQLVPAILNADAAPAAALTALHAHAATYNGFNLLAGEGNSATWMSNRVASKHDLVQGVHGLSNAQLDTPWPKLTRTKGALSSWAERGDEALAPLFAALADRTQAPDADLPATAVSLAWDRLLSAPFIVSADYGTRCSTILAIAHSGRAVLVERSFDSSGTAVGEVRFEFDVPLRKS